MGSTGPITDEGGDHFASVGLNLVEAAPGLRLGMESNLEGQAATASTQLPAVRGLAAAAGLRRYPHEEPAGKAAGEEVSRPSSSLRSDPPARKDTEGLIAEIFREECGAASSISHVGSSPGGTRSLGILQQHYLISQAEEEIPPPPPPGHACSAVQRRMEELREELRDGQSQWEVHEQIGKGGFRVVYKVGGSGRGSL